MRIPAFTAERSLSVPCRFSRGHDIRGDAGVATLASRPCPPGGMCAKASRMCPNPDRGGLWCDILSRCSDCGDPF